MRLYNGLSGFIGKYDVSDNPISNLKERLQEGMMLHARIDKIDVDKVSTRLVSRGSGTRTSFCSSLSLTNIFQTIALVLVRTSVLTVYSF